MIIVTTLAEALTVISIREAEIERLNEVAMRRYRNIEVLRGECDRLRAALERIKAIPNGPDRGSAQSQIDLAVEFASDALGDAVTGSVRQDRDAAAAYKDARCDERRAAPANDDLRKARCALRYHDKLRRKADASYTGSSLEADTKAGIAALDGLVVPADDALAIREAALATHHCETDGCAVEGNYTKRAAEWADKWHAMKARIAELEARLAVQPAAVPASEANTWDRECVVCAHKWYEGLNRVASDDCPRCQETAVQPGGGQ